MTEFHAAVDRLLDAIEGDGDEFDVGEVREAAHQVQMALPETFDSTDISVRETRLVGALCRLAEEVTSIPRLVRSKQVKPGRG